MFKKILLRSVRVLPLLLLAWLGFLFSFRLISGIASLRFDIQPNQFKHMNESITLSMVRLVTMTLGNYNNEQMGLGNGVSSSTWVTYTIYLSCIFIVVLLLVNMFLGISIDELSNLIDKSHNQNVKLRCEYVLRIQHVLIKSKLKYLLRWWLVKQQQQPNNLNTNSNSNNKSYTASRFQPTELLQVVEEILEKINIMDDKINYTQAKLSEKISSLENKK